MRDRGMVTALEDGDRVQLTCYDLDLRAADPGIRLYPPRRWPEMPIGRPVTHDGKLSSKR